MSPDAQHNLIVAISAVALLLGFPVLTFVAGLRRGRRAPSEATYRHGYLDGYAERARNGAAHDAAQAAPWPPPDEQPDTTL